MDEFESCLWEEETVPENAQNCRDCGLYAHGTRMVWGEGNPSAPILVLLDNPGKREDRDGNPFVCGTRETLQRAAYNAKIDKNELYVTYILKRRPARKYEKDKTRHICMQHLDQQLQIKHPRIVFCLGNVAVQSFFQNPEADVKSLRGKIHQVNGYHTAVAYHPLAVRRRPNLWSYFEEDWKLAAAYFRS